MSNNKPRPKPKFRVGQYLNLPVKVLKVDRRYNPEQYMVQGLVAGWIFTDPIEANELRPLPFNKYRKGER